MRLLLAAALLPFALPAQNCAPLGTVAPGTTLSGAVDESACRATDGTNFVAYSMTLPSQGRIQIDLSSDADLIVLLRASDDTLLDSGKSVRRAVERGGYTLVVSARTAGQTGSFSLRTSFVPEPAVWCRDFASIGLNAQASGTMGGSGCSAPDGSPYEAYALHSLGSGTLDIRASASGFTPSVTLRSDDGHQVATADGALSWPVDGDQDFVIVIAGGAGGGYTLNTSFRPADDETCIAQAVFTGSNQHSGAINGLSCTADSGNSGDPVSFNYYELRVADAGVADISVTSSAFDPALSLQDAMGNRIGSDQLAGGRGKSVLHLHLTPGSYTLRVAPLQPASGVYALQYTFSPGPAESCPVLDYNAGDTANGSMSAASCRWIFGLADVYRMTLPADGTIEVSLASLNFAAIVAIRDASDNTVIWDDSAKGLASSQLTADLKAGTYTIVASASSGSGAYQLVTRFTPHALGACPAPQDLPPNSGYIQWLGLGTCRGENGQPVDAYEFTLPADGTVAAVMTSVMLDGYITITDASGTFLRSDDNTYGSGDPLLVQFLPAGTYRLSARAARTSFGGAYRVDVLFQPGPRPPGCTARGKLQPGIPQSGNLNYSGCAYTDDTFADVYEFELSDLANVNVSLASNDFDAYLVMLDAHGNVIDEDDNGGTGTDSHILRPLAPGHYFVVAKPAQDFASQGDYSLTFTLE